MTKLRVLSLFAGIGGFDLGLERTGGFETVAFCEIDPFCQRVLAKHWPGVPCYDDVRTLTSERLEADGIAVDVICGGFPCQDISFAGRGAGLAGERSGLWSDYARLVGELRPSFIIVENVGALLHRGLDAVLGTLASIGYDAEWHCLPASALGAPHRRDRLWIVAHPNGGGRNTQPLPCPKRPGGTNHNHADEPGQGCRSGSLAHPNEPRLQGWLRRGLQECASEWPAGAQGSCWVTAAWGAEPDVGRVAYGVPKRVDRLKALGNAVVPQIPELIGNAILASLAEQRRAA